MDQDSDDAPDRSLQKRKTDGATIAMWTVIIGLMVFAIAAVTLLPLLMFMFIFKH